MSERSEPRITPLRLVLDFGETVELDGSTLYDPTSETAVPAVLLRMPPHRAAYLGKVLDAYSRVCRLIETELPADERGPAWALRRTAAAAGLVDPDALTAWAPVTSARRMAAAAVLQAAQHLDNTTTIAVVDAAARWLDESDGEEYAYALLGAVTDCATQLRAYSELAGTGWAATDGRQDLAASGIRLPELSNEERERLAVLRLSVLAADPTAEKLLARRVDVIALLAVVDRMTQGPGSRQ